MSPFSLRRCGPTDRAALEALGRATYREHFARIWSEAGIAGYLDAQWDRARLEADLAGDQVRYFVAEGRGRALGFMKLVLGRPVPVPGGAVGVELEKVYVRGDAQGLGSGPALVELAVREALAAGAPVIWLDVLKDNERAQRAYARAGFRVVGELPFTTDLGRNDFWIMERVLAGTGG